MDFTFEMDYIIIYMSSGGLIPVRLDDRGYVSK